MADGSPKQRAVELMKLNPYQRQAELRKLKPHEADAVSREMRNLIHNEHSGIKDAST